MGNFRVWITSGFMTRHQSAEVRCRGCKRVVVFPAKMFNDMFQPPISVSEAEKRLRCRQCGARDAIVVAVFREYHG
ncbi:ribosomal protein S27E [Sphingomonas jejuensis]|uniref:Ribosomal protein S27E n=1 Tax=Sphingomonas jejuensis TaxID=904715 RepID=A0ABX0XMZ6_9SPHN|nr:hypothetical protein [Sphingomonas jejuensis]NJC34645.1 ribosomal protein S27E [Sphingomonas jejuensis]